MSKKIKVTKKCCKCGKEFDFYLTEFEILEIDEGKNNIQYILPTLTPDERELFISGMCGKCFDEIFSGE